MRLSMALLLRSHKVIVVACWPLLPLGALFYLAGMTSSYIKMKVADWFEASDRIGYVWPAICCC